MPTRLHHRIFVAVRSFVCRQTVERELEEELQFHLEQMEEREVAHGAGRGDAHIQARRRFGGLDQVKERCRDMRTLRPVEDFLQDVRFGSRLLVRGPVFTAVAVMSLAIGIGASSAIFSLINAIVLRPLPVPQPEELYLAQVTRPGDVNLRFSYPVFESARELLAGRAELCAQSSIEAVRIATRSGAGVSTSPQPARMQLVSGNCFAVLRQRAQVGRLLGPGDDLTRGGPPVVVISDGFWTRRFGRAATVVGSELFVNGAAVTVVGVTTPEFFGATVDSRGLDLWAAVVMQAELDFAGTVRITNGDTDRPWPSQRELAWVDILLRIPSGGLPAVTQALNLTLQRESVLLRGYQADADLRRRIEASGVTLVPGSRGFSPMRNELTWPLVALLAMVGLLLVIACGNIASLLLARAASRHREIAIRFSIGAFRGRVVRQLLTESLLLALIGGALGLLLARWGSTALLAFISRGEPPTGIDVSPDWRVIAVTFIISVMTALLFGLLPAMRSTRLPLVETLKSQTPGAIGSGIAGGQTRTFLVSGQVVFSLLLLILAALFGRSLQELMRVDVGFDREHVLVARFDPRAAGYTLAELPQLHRRLLEGAAAIPGVTAASLSTNGPFSGSGTRRNFEAEGYTRGPDERPVTEHEWVTPDYFRTVGLAIRKGRGFDSTDTADARRVTVINETMARRYFRDRDPLGMRWAYNRNLNDAGFEIVGVVEDARYSGRDLRGEPLNMVYLPVAQDRRFLQSLEVQVAGDPSTFAAAVRNALRQVEPRLPVVSIETLKDRVARSLGFSRLLAGLTTAFGVIALCVACLGLFGTMSYAVTRRTMELGMRMALGAGRGTVQRLIMGEALTLVLIGLLIALPLSYLAARAMGQLLYGIVPYDLTAYGAAVTALVLVAALAAYLPARRASRLDPMKALRAE